MSDYWAMGGYAAFVWPAYGVSALVMAALAVTAWRGLRRKEIDLAQLQAIRQSLQTPIGNEIADNEILGDKRS
jgi:heme exporter protein D